MRLIDADAFDERVRVAGGMSEEELTDDFKDGVLAVLELLKTQPTAVPDTVKDLVTIFQNSKDMKLIARDGDLRADLIVAGRMPLEWIPVTERLPNDDEDVLVTNDAGGMTNIEIDSMGSYEDGSERFWWNSQNPVAWMPLPEPYEEKG